MKGGFFKKNLKLLAHNQIVLYSLVVLAVMNLVGYLVRDNLAAIILFLMVGFGATYLTKNMIYVLLSSILITNFLVKTGIMKNLGFREGMKHGKDNNDDDADDHSDDHSDDDSHDDDNNDDDDDDDVGKEALEGGPGTIKRLAKGAAKGALNALAEPTEKKKKDKNATSGFSNIKDSAMILNKPKPILAKTVEAAYDNLSNILGSDSLKQMEKDTSRLAGKQKLLVDQIKKMEPLMKNATNILKNFNIGSLDGISDIINKIGGK